MTAVLRVDQLSVSYRRHGRAFEVLRDVGLEVGRGESYGIVGESGCGKSTLALCVVRYLPANGVVSRGTIGIDGHDVLALDPQALRQLRRTTVAMVYQDPGRALNPSLRAGEQIAEIYRLRGLSTPQARDLAVAALKRVRLEAGTYDRYAHQLSGGMQQRVVIAMALAIEPRLLVLDEPTTGLDATVADEILGLIGDLRREVGLSVLFISHDLGVIARMCNRVGVLYAGELIEEGPTAQILDQPRHPYTVGLLRSVPRAGRTKHQGRLDALPGSPPSGDGQPSGCRFAPRCGLAEDRCTQVAPPLYDLGTRRSRCHFHERALETPRFTPAASTAELGGGEPVDRTRPPLLRALNISKSFDARHPGQVLRDVSLELWAGETLGLVGESGSGKTTLARILVGLVAPDSGSIELDGRMLAPTSRRRRAQELGSLQLVFQNPDSALNRSHPVRRLIGRVIDRFARVSRAERLSRVLDLLRAVRLTDRDLDRRTRELSGGMKQRVAIARAFACDPRVVVCDEPTSALDVSVQASILNLLAELQSSRRVSYLYISHDLATVRYLSDRIAVLYRGRLLELGPAARIFSGPHHPYTALLMSAISTAAPAVRTEDDAASAPAVRHGCVFQARCPRKLGSLCEEREPPLHPGGDAGHVIRCHIPAVELG
jgi:peptide/nickel transport system ATP-binding protein